jgi:hypothetical protein
MAAIRMLAHAEKVAASETCPLAKGRALSVAAKARAIIAAHQQ